MSYQGVLFQDNITIEQIYSIHYFEYMSDFSFAGESHDFWEFVCVDKGEVRVTSNSSYHILKKGEIAFHKPNEFHDVHATGETAPNLVVISFECKNSEMEFFEDKILHIDHAERNLLANIIIEARNCFQCRLDDPFMQNMPIKKDIYLGAGQLIRIYLEQFLIHLLRRYEKPFAPMITSSPDSKQTLTKNNSDEDLFLRISEYLEAHIQSHVKIEQICHDNLIGRSQLQRIFKSKRNMGVIEYYFHLKTERAKELIRTEKMNFTQIAEFLGYTTIHYFSRQFKKQTGMTPSEYASSIKAIAEEPHCRE